MTVYKLTRAVVALQKKERLLRIADLKDAFAGKQCIGVQFDFWTDTGTHTSYAGITITYVRHSENTLVLCSELLDFNV
jgi:hypothetical protein